MPAKGGQMFINTHILDVTGSCFSFLSVIYSIRAKAINWLFTILATCIGIVLYFQKGLYADVGLNVFYLVLGFYGWYTWLYGGKNRTTKRITNLSSKMLYILCIISLLGISLITLFLKLYTDSKIPLWDASTTVISVVAYWLACRKIIQSWYLWFIVDGLFAGMYFFKNIPFHGFLYMFYVILAAVGYLKWKKQMTVSDVEMEYEQA